MITHLRSLRAQLTLTVAFLVLAISVLAGLALTIQMDHRDRAALDGDLQERANLLSQDIDSLLSSSTESDSVTGISDLLNTSPAFARVISASSVLAQIGTTPETDLELPGGLGFSTVSIDGESWRSWVTNTDVTGDLQVQVLQNTAQLEDRLDDNRRLLAIVTVIATLLAGVGAWFLIGLVIAPLERLRRDALAARKAGASANRLPVARSPQEVHDLAIAFNAFQQQTQTSMVAIRRFTADAGRELRAPLTSLGTYLEMLRRNPTVSRERLAAQIESMLVEHERMLELLEGLQTLARGDAGVLPAHEFIDIAELVGYCVRQAQYRHPRATYRLYIDIDETTVVEGWADGIRLAIDHLLDNAALHGKASGRIDVGVGSSDGWVDIVVNDDGPGIPIDLREPLKERFARGPSTHSEGSGLGLALVDQQVALHCGALTLDDGPNGGLSATLSLHASALRMIATTTTRRPA